MTGRSQGFDLNLMQTELHRSGRQSTAVDTISILQKVDEAIKDERDYVTRISQRFIALDVLVTIITFAVAFGYLLAIDVVEDYHHLTQASLWFEFLTAVVNAGNAIILAYASWSIRKSILAQSDLKPNSTLVNIHVFNCLIFTVLFLTETSIKAWAIKVGEDNVDTSYWSEGHVLEYKLMYFWKLNETITSIFNTWMNMFLIYLLLRFTQEKQSMMKDQVLRREVPSIVFINN